MSIIKCYVIAKPKDLIDVLDRKTGKSILNEFISWEKVLTKNEYHQCRDGLNIYKDINLNDLN